MNICVCLQFRGKLDFTINLQGRILENGRAFHTGSVSIQYYDVMRASDVLKVGWNIRGSIYMCYKIDNCIQMTEKLLHVILF